MCAHRFKCKWLIGTAHNIGRCSSLQAELLALIDGLELAWNEGHMFVKVEVDCLLALNLLKQEGKQVNVFSSFIRQILSLFGRDWQIEIQHVYREGNKCADYLATYALQLEVGRHLLQQPPDGLQYLLHEDELGIGQERLIYVVWSFEIFPL